MMTAEQVEAIREQMTAEGAEKTEIIRQVALACMGFPYVFGAWGEECSPAQRRRRVRDDHPTIKSKCQVLNGKKGNCTGCQWYPEESRVRMYDCRGFTHWLLTQVGLGIWRADGKACQGATSQYNTAANWVQRGTIEQMPDCVCCVFRQKGNTMEHTGMHVGGGVVIDCSVNVRSCGMSGWTHYAIPVGLYEKGEIPVTVVKPTLRKGAEGDLVKELQSKLNELGYNCGTVDGKFGSKTFVAVKEFQSKHGLQDDGIVGRLTWAELDKASAPKEPTYKVICCGMTFEQSMQIREICPTASMEKEW